MKTRVFYSNLSLYFPIYKHFRGRLTRLLSLVLLAYLSLAQLALADANNANTKWNVLLITVDCLRPDHMSVYGYERDTTPNLKRFAQQSLVFENAYATSVWTSPGIVSMLTGYYPSVHAQNGRYSFYDQEMASPLRIFEEQGYEVLGQAIKGPSHKNLGFKHGLRKGNGLERLIEEKSKDTKPFFAWIHTKETHLPYTPSEQNLARWAGDFESSEGVEAVQNHFAIFRPHDTQVSFQHAGNVAFTKQDAAVIRALYDGEVADIDQRLGRAIERMRETGLLDRTIVIISADHGEELLEHGWVGHASTSYDGKLYDELTHIPLMIRLPNQSLTGRFDALVQSTDLMPTLMELLGFQEIAITPEMQGHSLLPLIEGRQSNPRDYVFAETTHRGWTTPKTQMQNRITMVRSKNRKLIRHVYGDKSWLEAYDLKLDSTESHNLYSHQAERFQDLEKVLATWSENNRDVAASLVLPAAHKQLRSMVEELERGSLVGAVDHWRNIAVMHNTWGLEAAPFYHFEPYQTKWQQLRLSAANQLAQVMQCEAQTGRWRQTASENTIDSHRWVCK